MIIRSKHNITKQQQQQQQQEVAMVMLEHKSILSFGNQKTQKSNLHQFETHKSNSNRH